MRFNGIIKTWNDERGFGFISPSHGGQEIFVHIKAFPRHSARPQVGEAVTFEVELNRDGKKRATAVKPVNAPASFRKQRQGDSARWGVASYLAIPAFMVLYVAAAFLWEVPAWVVGVYAGASILAFATYGIDKFAAVSDSWRIPEYVLLLTGLLGGWPGAIIAQQVMRHKSSKASFRSAFWHTVFLNVVAFVALASPLGQALIQAQVAP